MVLRGEDRELGAGKRLVVRMHCLFCASCTSFGKQVVFMRKTSEQWRRSCGQ